MMETTRALPQRWHRGVPAGFIDVQKAVIDDVFFVFFYIAV